MTNIYVDRPAPLAVRVLTKLIKGRHMHAVSEVDLTGELWAWAPDALSSSCRLYPLVYLYGVSTVPTWRARTRHAAP